MMAPDIPDENVGLAALLNEAHGVLRWYAARFAQSGLGWECEDLYQEGILACLTQLTSMPVPQVSWGIAAARWRMQQCLMDASRDKQRRSLFTDDRAPFHPDMILMEHQFIATIKQVVATCTARQQRIFTLYYDEGLTVQEIGRLVGLDHSGVSRELGKVTTALQACFDVVPESQPATGKRWCHNGHAWTPENIHRFTTQRGYVQESCKVCRKIAQQANRRQKGPIKR